ncbi:MAG: PTS transporter subunit EIIA [bacterium]|nr:PTS transporter subunit EIIA [bacterium]
MKLSSLLNAHGIVLGLESKTLADAVRELLSRAEGFRPAKPIEEIAEAVLRREAQGSTAAEQGLCIPHARIPDLQDFYLLFGTCKQPLEEKGLDGQPIDLVVLLLSDDQKTTLMLQSMAAIGGLAQQPESLDTIRAAASRDAVWQFIHDMGIEIRKTLLARDLMRPAAFVASVDMPMQQLLDLFFEHSVDEAAVCDLSRKVIGCVTSREIVEAGFPNYMGRIPDISFLPEFEAFEQFFKREATTLVREILNPNPLVVDAEDPVIQVVFKMRQEHHRIAFVEEDGRYVGLIDRRDIISRILRA